MPSFNRDLKDIVRVNPLASVNGNGELTIAGNNPRTNSLSVDGISQNDDFGLNYGGYPTQQPPVALDAIEQVSVDFAPFSASKGNFGGGSINAVTKSGTNEFKFSGYYETSTPSMIGDVLDIDEQRATGDSTERTLEEKEVAPIQTEQRYGFSVALFELVQLLFLPKYVLYYHRSPFVHQYLKHHQSCSVSMFRSNQRI
jgi:hypothetical protein